MSKQIYIIFVLTSYTVTRYYIHYNLFFRISDSFQYPILILLFITNHSSQARGLNNDDKLDASHAKAN